MSNTIDEKVVEMRFDNSDFESNVKTSMSTLDKLKSSLNLSDSAKEFDNISKAASSVSFDGMNAGLLEARNNFSMLEGVATIVLGNIVTQAVNAGIKIAESLSIDLVGAGWGQYEEKTKSVQTIMNATGLSIDEVNSRLDKLIWFTDETSYSFSDMTNNIGKFTSMGVDLDRSVNAMMGISNWAAVSGAGINEASRAMYNLSQAMGVGAVTAIDWKSIENANMATKEFKQQVIDTAKALGKLSESGMDAEGHLVGVENFRETLKDKWFDNDVLLAVLEKYSDYTNQVYDVVQEQGGLASDAMETLEDMGAEYEEIGKKSFKAAQEAKTFTDAIQATKDAVKSKWAGLFEDMFGNYEEEKVTWTNLANTLYDMFAQPVADIGDAFTEALDAPTVSLHDWHKLRTEMQEDMGLSAEAVKSFEDVVTATAKQQGIDIDGLIEKYGSLDALFANGFIKTDTIKSAMDVVKEGFVEGSGSVEEFGKIVDDVINLKWGVGEDRFNRLTEAGYNWEEIQGVVDDMLERGMTLEEAMANRGIDVESTISGINEELKAAFENDELASETLKTLYETADGRTLRNMALNNIIEAMGAYSEAAKEAIDEVFGTLSSDTIKNAIQNVYEWSLKLLDTERIDRFKHRFKVVMTVIHSVISLLGKAWSLVSTVANSTIVPVVKGIVSILTSLFDSLGQIIIQFDEALSSGEGFQTFLSNISTFLDPFKTKVDEASSSVTSFISGIFQKGEDGENSGIGFVLETLGTIVEWVKSNIPSLSQILSYIQMFISGAFMAKLIGFISGLRITFGEVLTSIVLALGKVTEVLSDMFTTIASRMSGGMIMNCAIAIGVVAASLIALSFVDPEKLDKVASVLTIVAGGLSILANSLGGLMTAFGGSDNEGNTIKGVITGVLDTLKDVLKARLATNALIKVAAALILFAGAMFIIAQIGWEGIAKGLTAMGAVLLMVFGYMKLINKYNVSYSGTFNLIVFGTSMLIFGLAIKMVSGLDWSGIAKGLASIGGVLLAVALFSKIASTIPARNSFGLNNIAISMLIFGLSIKIVADLDWSGIAKGLASIGVVLLEVALFSRIASKIPIRNSFGLNSIAISMLIFGLAIRTVSNLEWSGIAKGLVAIGSVLLEVALYSKIASNIPLTAIASLITIATSMVIFGRAIKNVSDLEWEGIAKGLVSIGAVLLEVALFSRMASSINLKNSIGIIAIATSMLIFGTAIKKVADLGWKQIAKGLGGIAAVLLLVSMFSKMTGNISLAGAGGMIAMATSLLIFGAAVKSLADISWGDLQKGVIVLAELLGVLAISSAILGKIGATLWPISVFLLSAAALISSIASAVFFLGGSLESLDKINLFDTLSRIFTDALKALLNTITNSVDNIFQALLSMLTGLVDYAPQLVDQLVNVIVVILDSLSTRLPELATSLANFCGDLIAAFAEAFAGVDVSPITSVFAGLLASALTITAIGKFGSIASVTKGIIMFAEVVGAIGLLVTAFGALNAIPGLSELMSGGIEIFGIIGEAIGTFIGKIVGGAMEGVTSSLPDVATNLSSFMTNLSGFIDGMSSIDETFTESISRLTLAILELTGAGLVDAILGIPTMFTGTDSFLDKFVALGEALGAFSDSISDIDFTSVEAATNAGNMIATLAAIIPSEGGLFSWITGTKDFSNAKVIFSDLGSGVASFMDAIGGTTFDSSSGQTVQYAAEAISSLMAVVPNEGGLWQMIVGESAIGSSKENFKALGEGVQAFAEAIGTTTFDEGTSQTVSYAADAVSKLMSATGTEGGLWQKIVGESAIGNSEENFKNLGLGIKAFVDAIGSDSVFSSETADSVANATAAITALMAEVPSEGGLWQMIVGESTISSSEENFKSLGLGIKAFVDAIGESTFGSDTASSVTYAAEAVAALMSVAPSEGGLFGWITGEVNLSDFAYGMGALGAGLKIFVQQTEGISAEAIENAHNAVVQFATLLYLMPTDDAGVERMITFGTNIVTFGENLKSFMASLDGVDADKLTSIQSLIASLSDSMGDTETSLVNTESFSTLAQSLVTSFKDAFSTAASDTDFAGSLMSSVLESLTQSDQFKSAGIDNMTSFKNGMESYSGSVTSTASSIATNVGNGMKQYNLFYQAAVSDMSGFNSGMSAYAYTLYSRAASITNGIVDAFRNESAFRNLGMYNMQGYERGLEDYRPRLIERARQISQAVVDEMYNTTGTHSPSTKLISLGRWNMIGWGQGIDENGKIVINSAKDVSKRVIKTIRSSLSSINLDGIDDSPVIRPVLDLSEIQNGARGINGILGAESTLRLNTISASRIAGQINRRTAYNDLSSVYDDSNVISTIKNLENSVDNLGVAITKMGVNINGKKLVGEIISDIDKGLGARSIKQMRGVN